MNRIVFPSLQSPNKLQWLLINLPKYNPKTKSIQEQVFQMQLAHTTIPLQMKLFFSMQGRPSAIDSPAPAHLLIMPTESTTIICHAA